MSPLIRVLVLAVTGCAFFAPAAAQNYSCVVFPPYGGFAVHTSKINNLGESVGTVGNISTSDTRAAIFRSDGAVKYVHDVPSIGFFINDSGNAVFRLINSATGNGVGIAFYEAASNTAATLTLPVDPGSLSLAGIDNTNTIYGTSYGTGAWAPFKIRGGRFIDLSPVLGQATLGGVSSTGGGLTGGLKTADETSYAFRHRPAMRRPADLTRLFGPGVSSFGRSINSSFTVVGEWVPGPTNRTTGFIVVGQTVYDDVRYDATHEYSWVTAVNEAGDAVGQSAEAPTFPGAAFHWRAGVMTLLTCPGRRVGVPNDINDQGVILTQDAVMFVPTN
jgi:hypothetical protein